MKLMLINISVLGALALILAGFIFAPRDEIETRIWIEAAPERVWALLTDPGIHASLSPGLRRIEGHFDTGERLTLEMDSPTGGSLTIRPRVLLAQPARELRWRGRIWLPRLLDGEHYFKLTPENGGTRLVQGERFQGVLLWLMNVKQFEPEFDRMNAALKAHLENER